MDSLNINRINELARKQRTVGLTDEEKAEQAKLRENYIKAIRADIQSSLDNVTMVNKDGSTSSLKEEHELRQKLREGKTSMKN